MLKFGRLVLNEWLKISKKKSFFIAYAVMLLAVAGLTYVIQEMSHEQRPSILDFVVSIISKNGIGQILTIIAIIFTAGIMAKEHQLGTIKLLLIRAHSRSSILASKVVVAFLFVGSLILFTVIVGLASSGLAFGFGAGESTWLDVAEAALYLTIYTLIYTALTFMFGVMTKSTGATIGIGMTAVLLEGVLNLLLANYDFSRYLIFMNTDLSVYASGGAPMDGMTLTFSSIVAAFYVVLFMGISFVTFKKRDIA